MINEIPPVPTDVTAYAKSIGFNLDGEQFCDYYETVGWMRGKTKIKSWQACVRTWKRNASLRGNGGHDYGYN